MSKIAGEFNGDYRSADVVTSVSHADGESSLPSDPPDRVYADGICSTLVTLDLSNRLRNRFQTLTFLLVMNEQERYESLRHCKWVDEVIPDAPWVINQEFLDKHHIAYVAHDALPYADASGAGKDVYEFVKKVGRFKETKRTEGISTSDIIYENSERLQPVCHAQS